MDIIEIQQYCTSHKIEWTLHAAKRLLQRGISALDIEASIWNGVIIENYPDDYPFLSCLIMGKTMNNCILHIVCAIGDDKLWIITAYEPDLKEWETDLRTRKEDK